MEKKRNQYTFFFSYYDAISELDPDKQLFMRVAIDEFMLYDKDPDFEDRTIKAVWKALLPNLNKSKARSEANGEREHKGNQHTKPREQQTATNCNKRATNCNKLQQTCNKRATNAETPLQEEEREEEIEEEIEEELGEGEGIVTPSLNDVLDYWQSKYAEHVTEYCARKFYAYFNEHSKWSRDWKASFDTWAARERDFDNTKKGKQTRQELDPYAYMLQEQEERERKERDEADVPKGLAALNEYRKQREPEHIK